MKWYKIKKKVYGKFKKHEKQARDLNRCPVTCEHPNV